IQSAGTNSITSGHFYVGGFFAGGNGTYTLKDSGAIVCSVEEDVGYNGAGAFIQSAGSNTINGSLCIGRNADSSGAYTLSGGSVSVGGSVDVGGSDSTAGGAATFTMNGGTLHITGSLKIYNAFGNSFNFNAGNIDATSLNDNGNPTLFNWT